MHFKRLAFRCSSRAARKQLLQDFRRIKKLGICPTEKRVVVLKILRDLDTLFETGVRLHEKMIGLNFPCVREILPDCNLSFGRDPPRAELTLAFLVASNGSDRQPAEAVVPDSLLLDHLRFERSHPAVIGPLKPKDAACPLTVRVVPRDFPQDMPRGRRLTSVKQSPRE